MCLTEVDKKFKAPAAEKEMVGYKFFLQTKDGLLDPPCYGEKGLSVGNTYKAPLEFLSSDKDWGEKYPSGFHFCRSKKATKKYMDDAKYFWPRFADKTVFGELQGREFVLVKCRFSEIRAKGTQELWGDGVNDAGSITCYTAGVMTLLEIVG